jgi:hypothetical protein
LKFEKTRKSLRDIMKFIPPKKVKLHYTDFEDEVVFREEGRPNASQIKFVQVVNSIKSNALIA